ncbi:LysM peptidoglycan-binding domain-containing protein [Clostridium guangxiense]|nr:LysM peptidoglycan-binding domain-containing protein [Clostridium guangxiense]
MSKGKLLFILCCIFVFLVGSYAVYYNKYEKNNILKKVSQSNLVQQSSSNNIATNDKRTTQSNSDKTSETSVKTNNSINSYEVVKTVSEDSDYVYIKYRLKKGDHLWSLAERFMPTYKTSGVVKEIEKQNSLKNDNEVTKDASLIIPAEKKVVNN